MPAPATTDTVGKLYGRQMGPDAPIAPDQSGVVASPHMLGGMVVGVPRDQLSAASGSLVRNMRVRNEELKRRPGTAEFGTNVTNQPVLGIVMFINESGDVFVCRIDNSTFYVTNAAAIDWIQYDVSDARGDQDGFPFEGRFTYAQFFESLFMADGSRRIREIDFGHQTVQELEEAPRAKFVMNFADRLVAANLRLHEGGVRPSAIAWSVNGNPRDWTGLGSGLEDLAVEDIGDAIAGIIPLQNEALIIRRRSVWLMNRQPFQAPVFRFQRLVPGVGCDLPYSVQKVPGGVIFADQRTREVYYFSLAQGPQRLAQRINKVLYDDLKKLSFAEASYDPFEREYHLAMVIGDGEEFLNRTWVLDLETFSWSYDDSPVISTLGIVSLPGASVAIDDLIGTIDAQTVEIDEYGEKVALTPGIFKGLETGEVLKQSYEADHDWDGSMFEGEFISQNLGSQVNRRSFKDLTVRVLAESGGDVVLEERSEEGTWRHTKTTALTALSRIQNVRLPKKGVTGNDLYWRLRTTAPGIGFKSYWTRLVEKSRQR